jgi:hypothetical protein
LRRFNDTPLPTEVAQRTVIRPDAAQGWTWQTEGHGRSRTSRPALQELRLRDRRRLAATRVPTLPLERLGAGANIGHLAQRFRGDTDGNANDGDEDRSMSLIERFRRLWTSSLRAADHPLTAKERSETREQTAYDEIAANEARYVGGFDPYGDRRG